jgi:hypothetical protein
MDKPDSHATVEDIRRLMEGDGFADLIAGKVVSISAGEKLLRALAMAAKFGHLQLAEELVNEGAEVGRAGDALVAAAENDQVPVLKFLLAAGVPVDLQDEMFGATALMHAAGSGAVEPVKVLLASGADPHAEDHEGKTASAWAEMGLNTGYWESTVAEKAESAYRQVIAILAALDGGRR